MATARSTMSDLITKVRLMIGDPSGVSQQFADLDIQAVLDNSREDVRYEGLTIAPSIVNTTSTNNMAQTIFADYYSKFQYWENDVVLQGYNNGAPWIVLTPVSSEPIVGHWAFESNVFTAGTVPGQLPPVFATGKVYDIYCAAADLLEFWTSILTSAYDFTSDAQSFHRSQKFQMKMKLAEQYRFKAKPRVVKMDRHDVLAPISTRRMRLMDNDDVVKGA